MAIYKDIPRFDGSGITEYYRINDGKIVKLSSDYDFLEDKPMINGVVLEGDLSTADLNIPVGDITQLKTEIKDNIVNAINELHTEANDFEKFITDKVNAIISFTIVWVAKLPAKKDAKPNTVYLVPKTSMIEEDNYCEEFIFTDGHWEKIGDTKVDLSGYYTKEETDSIIQALEGQVNIILQDYATKEELNNVTEELRNDITDIITNKVGDLEELVIPDSNTVVEALNQIYNTKNSYYLISQLDSNDRLIEVGQQWLNDFINGQHSDVYYLSEWSGNIIFRYIKMTDADIDYNQHKIYWDFDSSIYDYGKYNQPRNTFRIAFTLTSDNKITGVTTASNQNYLLDAYQSYRPGIGKWGLATDNTTSYTPTEDYNPATKKYVDDTVRSIDLSPYATTDYVDTQTGSLVNLETDAKDNLVNAINEANSRLSYVLLDVGAFRSNILAIDSTMTISSNSTGYSAAKEAGDKIHQNKQMPILAAGIYDHIWLTYNGSFNSSGAMHGYTYEGILNDDGYYYIGTASFYYRDSDNSFVSLRFSTKSSKAPVAKDKILTKTNTTEYTPTKDYHPSTKLYVDTAISNAIKDIHSFEIQIVDQLPTDNILTNTLYLVPSEKVEDNNTKDEYIYTGSDWEMIGTTKVDLSNYYTKPEVDEKVDNLYLRCNRDEYEAMSQEDRDSFLIAIVDDIAVLSEQDLTNVTKILGGNASADMEIDISTNEAIAITDKIIGGTE